MPELVAGGVGLPPVPNVAQPTDINVLMAGVDFQSVLTTGYYQVNNDSVLRTGQAYQPYSSGIDLSAAKLLSQIPAFLVEGYRERFRSDGDQEVIAAWDVPWSYRKAWVDWTIGHSTTLRDQAGNPFITRSIPAQVPVPGYQHLYAVEVESDQLAGVLRPAGFIAYKGDGSLNPTAWAPWLAYEDPSTGKDGLIRYRVRYRPRPYEVLDDATMLAIPNTAGELERYIEWLPKGAVQALPLPTGTLKYGSLPGYAGNDPANTAVGQALLSANGGQGTTIPDNAAYLLLPTEEWVLTWHEVPDLPLDAMRAATGAVNNGAFGGARGWPLFPRGTLLCQAPRRERYRHVTGRWYWEVTYSFLYRPTTHQALPNAKDSNFYTVVKGDGSGLYAEADFNALFKPPAPVPNVYP